MPDWDLLIERARVATMTPAGAAYGILDDAALAVSKGRIAWLGGMADLPAHTARKTLSAGGRWLTPALIDCHTHLLFAGNRAAEFELRLEGASYEELARAGGGIMATVRATRVASNAELLEDGLARLAIMRAEGVATVEIKSGYGLDLATELRLLRLARVLGEKSGVTVRTTFLGAHAVPAGFRGGADAYIDFLCAEVLPAVHGEGLADAVDAYCESIAFSAVQVERLFERAAGFGLAVKLHADQLSDAGGADLAARYGALSADHLEYTPPAALQALADAGTVAVLLPGAFVTLRETQRPPVDELRRLGVPMALATDCNPGTSPICSLQTIMALAACQFRMTPEECLAGVTRNAARALGLQSGTGTLEAGKRADLALWEFDHPRELGYWIGRNPLRQLFIAGKAAPA